MKTDNARTARQIEEQVPGLMREINEGLTADYDVDLALSVGGVVPLPPHDESERTFAFSLITKYEMTDLEGNPVRWEASATSTVVHLRAKVVFLYAVGQKEDLEWTREVSRKWASAVIAANPSTGVFAEQEQRRGFDWLRVVKYGVIGAVVAGLVSAFAARRKGRGNVAGPA
jgi:hypothetical protein